MELCSSPVIYLGPNYGGGNEDNGSLLQKVPCRHCYISGPSPAVGHCWPMPLPETPGHSQASLGQSLVESLLLSPGSWGTRFCLYLPRVCFPVLCKFWWLYGGVNGNLLQEGLCHTQVYCIQSPCPCGSPLLYCTSSGDTQTQFCLSFWEVYGSWCAQGLHKPLTLLHQTENHNHRKLNNLIAWTTA